MMEKQVVGYETVKGFFCLDCFKKKQFLDRLEVLKTFSMFTTDDKPYLCEEVQVCVDCGREFSTRGKVITK